ncbi:MAG: penicillin-binding protein 1C [Bacteroidales bacterium]|jgi:penicillin-binding protein 1C|nr:penicillin-binding protein 1C [Bacteroidales bacterium]
MKKIIKNKKLLILLSCIVILLIAYIFCLPRKLFDVEYATVVNDRNEDLLGARIASDQQWRFPPADSVPDKYKQCLLAFEDHYFYWHWGVNPVAMGRALFQNIKNHKIVSGGSTITMQVIRLSRNKNRNIAEKIWESILATRLEFRYSKEKILILYASHAPFGGNIVGIEAASWRFFGHAAHQLSWSEASVLAILPNAPALLHLSKNRQALLEKRDRLLKKLKDNNTIDQITYELAIVEPLPSEPQPLPQNAPHLVNYFFKNKPGNQIHSTINKELQSEIEALLQRRNSELLLMDIRNMAAIVIDIQTNEIIAYCGNVNFNQQASGNQVDIITSERSTGSILKPFLFYLALQEGTLLPNTLIPDIPLNINGFMPKNFNLQYDGAVPASKAVARSLNVPMVWLLKQYSVPKFYDFLKNNGIMSLKQSPSHYGLSLILGGAEATLGEITNGYANMGRSLLGIENRHFMMEKGEKTKVMKTPFESAAVWQVFEAIKEVNRPEEIDWRNIPSMQSIAWKTGTSYGYRDAWAVGVNSKYAVGVWVGNASGEGKPELLGAKTAGPIMFDIFEHLPSAKWFPEPTSKLTPVEVCHQSGHLKGRFCEEIDTVKICARGTNTTPCPYHISVTLSLDEKYRVYENCIADNQTTTKTFFVLPPSWAWYYKQNHPNYKSLPPFLKGCGGDDEKSMQFVYPLNNSRIKIAKQMDGSKGKITFEVAHTRSNATLFWHINNQYTTSTTDFHTISINLSAGKHHISVTDDEGNTTGIAIEVWE